MIRTHRIMVECPECGGSFGAQARWWNNSQGEPEERIYPGQFVHGTQRIQCPKCFEEIPHDELIKTKP